MHLNVQSHSPIIKGLRNLELCDTLAQLSESHRKEAEEFVKKFSTDAALQLMIHQSRSGHKTLNVSPTYLHTYMLNACVYQCRCEAAALVQTAVHRFNTSLHLIFDYAKVNSETLTTLYISWRENVCIAYSSERIYPKSSNLHAFYRRSQSLIILL